MTSPAFVVGMVAEAFARPMAIGTRIATANARRGNGRTNCDNCQNHGACRDRERDKLTNFFLIHWDFLLGGFGVNLLNLYKRNAVGSSMHISFEMDFALGIIK